MSYDIAKDEVLNAVKAAYLSASKGNHRLDVISSYCREEFDVEITEKQLSQIFFLMPSDVVGGGISWGFSDSEVRESIVSELEDKNDEILSIIQDIES